VVVGAAVLAIGAALSFWPAWSVGIVLVAAACLVYQIPRR